MSNLPDLFSFAIIMLDFVTLTQIVVTFYIGFIFLPVTVYLSFVQRNVCEQKCSAGGITQSNILALFCFKFPHFLTELLKLKKAVGYVHVPINRLIY